MNIQVKNTVSYLENLIETNPQIQSFIANFPNVQQKGADVFELVFFPRVIFKQLLLSIALELGAMTAQQLLLILKAMTSHFSSRSQLIRQLQSKQQIAATQDEWMDLAEQIDVIQGNDIWRSDPNCSLYESERISARMDEFVHLMRRQDIFDLMFTLRGGIARNKFGILHPDLFSKAQAGSKLLVETYHNVVCAALDYVCDADVPSNEVPIPTDARLAFFNETRHSYGRTALLLSGGAALGFYHVGVVKALMENGVMPRVLGGASAGSIVCAMIGTRTNEECTRDLFNDFGTNAPGHYGQLKIDFFRPIGYAKEENQNKINELLQVIHNPAGAFHDAKKTWQAFTPIGLRKFTSSLYDVITGNTRPKDILKNDTQHFQTCCKVNIGNFTFQEAFDRTGRILNITVSPQNRSDPPRLLNYLTAPHVLVWSAAVASSSLPGVFEPSKLLVKNSDGSERFESGSGARFLDGSMEADLPMQQLSEMFNVNHFIISQANPHAVMFSQLGFKTSIWSNPIISAYTNVLKFVKNQVKEWIRSIVELVGGQRAAPLWDTRRSFVSQFFTQEYEGRDCDVTLNPWAGDISIFSAFLHLLYNPTHKEYLRWMRAAERQTWKYISEIKSHIAEEITLDQCVQRLRKRLVQESWEAKMERAQVKNSKPSFSDTTGEKLGKRVPSFFTSPSLVKMSGLGVSDRLNLDETWTNGEEKHQVHNIHNYHDYNVQVIPKVADQISLGWGGKGLSGNRSLSSLNRTESAGSGIFNENLTSRRRSVSDASGIFVDDSDDDKSANGGDTNATSWRVGANQIDSEYFKTSSMAQFYYGRNRNGSQSHEKFPVRSDEKDDNTKKWKSSLDLSEHGRNKQREV